MTAVKTENGEWAVVHRGGVLAGPFATSSEAWRWIDRQTGEPISKGEDTAEWIFRKMVDSDT